MLQLEDLEFDYEPYPIGVARPVIADDLYREMVDDYPPIEFSEHTPGTGLKYVLSEKRRGKDSLDSIRSKPHWREFHHYIKSEEFIRYVLRSLKNKHIDIGLDCAVAPPGAGPYARRSLPGQLAPEYGAPPHAFRIFGASCRRRLRPAAHQHTQETHHAHRFDGGRRRMDPLLWRRHGHEPRPGTPTTGATTASASTTSRS